MREGLSTIQQTLTPEAASVLSLSIAEAGRRSHGQTTPLHVAATLLASPSGYLRRACIRSYPDSSHPLQSRALELCFSVALERLPAAQTMEAPGVEPPISNALMAALKRAQTHQRRGCPEQPLLAVKVELEQLIISILDDPGVSRVMREASFSSPAVKAAIEKSLSSSNSHTQHRLPNPPLPSSQIPNRNLYLNPRLQQVPKIEDMSKVFDVMSRRKKRNPIMVGDSDPNSMVKEFLRKIGNKEFIRDGEFKNAEVVSMETWKMEELEQVIESKIKNGGVILDLGDLKWLVEQPVRAAAVVEMKKLLARFCGGERGCKLWLIGAATCETYLRCQVYHSSMESDWDLQAVPISSPSSLPKMFPRLGSDRILSKAVESSCPLKAITTPLPALTKHAPENPGFSGAAQRLSLCPQCSESYEKELAKLGAIEKSFSETKQASPPSLPPWLQNAKANDESQSKDSWLLSKKAPDLQKKWRDTCLNLHQSRTAPPPRSMSSLNNPSLLSRTPFRQLGKPLGAALQLNTNRGASRALEQHPTSPVGTDLNLGWKGADEVSSEPPTKLFANALDVDTYKKLLKGLMEKAWWQAAAASAVASAITRCKRRGAGTRGDVWLLFAGPDRAGKRKMAAVIGEQVFGVSPVVICLGKRRDDHEESDSSSRGKTSIDRIVEAIRRNPFLVMVLEDIDEADMVARGSIERAMERGRLTDSHGREIGLGNAIFIVTGVWSISRIDPVTDGSFVDETKLASVASGGWQLRLIVRYKTGVKRRPSRLHDDNDADRPSKPGRELGAGLSLDLNLTAGFIDDEKTDGSNNSSDLTIDHDDDELALVNEHFSVASIPHDLASNADDAIVFEPVSSAFFRWEIKKAISTEFSVAVDENMSIEVEDEVLDRILGGLWHDRCSLKEWMDKVVVPSFDQLKARLPSADRSSSVVRLVMESESVDRGRKHGNAAAEWLPSSIHV